MGACHTFQREHCEKARKPILNAASKEDPARLGELFDAINVDLYEHDPHTGTDCTKLPNFICGDIRNLAQFEDGHFGTVVLGEILEHCTKEAAKEILLEAKRLLHPAGKIIATFPLDSRPPEEQHAKHLLIDWGDGITSWHQTVWTDEPFFPLLQETKLKIVERHALSYPFVRNSNPQGWGVILTHEENDGLSNP